MQKTLHKIFKKTISWQVVSTIIALLYTWWWLGSFSNSFGLIMTELVIMAGAYYIHEIYWNKHK